MKYPRLFRSLFIVAAAAAVGLAGMTSASASAPAKPSADCKVPVFSVSQTTAVPGTKITVNGKNFSGCSAQGNSAKPTAVLTVKVGVVTAAKVQEVLATTKTDSTGSFSVEVTVPSVPAGGEPKIALAAVAQDPATTLTYYGVASVTYSKPTSSAQPTSTSSATPASSSSVDVPTAVPAGSGGLGAPTSSAQLGGELGLGVVGMSLLVLGGYGMARRRVRQH